jgi:DNA invertase Pin-like site-specific DNA recombinase
LQILGAAAEFERQLILERIKGKLDYLKSTGKKLGRPQGSKDKKRRRKSGYLLRYSKK